MRNLIASDEFVEIYVKCPLEICEQRDVKGLYEKARRGTVKQFTGIDDPYEPPLSPELVLFPAQKTPETLADEMIAFLEEKDIIGKNRRR